MILTLTDSQRKTLTNLINHKIFNSNSEIQKEALKEISLLADMCVSDEATMLNLKEQRKKLENSLQNFQQNIENNNDKVEQLQAIIEQQKENYQNINDKIKNINKLITVGRDEAVKALNSTLMNIQSEINNSTQEIAPLKKLIKSDQDRVIRLQTQIKENQKNIEDKEPENKKGKIFLLAQQIIKSVKNEDELEKFLGFFAEYYEFNLNLHATNDEGRNGILREHLEESAKERIAFFTKISNEFSQDFPNDKTTQEKEKSFLLDLISTQDEALESLCIKFIENSIKTENPTRYLPIFEGIFGQICGFSDEFIKQFLDVIKSHNLADIKFANKSPIQHMISQVFFHEKNKVETVINKTLEIGLRLSTEELSFLTKTKHSRLQDSNFYCAYAKALVKFSSKNKEQFFNENDQEFQFIKEILGLDIQNLGKMDIYNLTYLITGKYGLEEVFKIIPSNRIVSNFITLKPQEKLSENQQIFLLKCALKSHSKDLITQIANICDKNLLNYDILDYTVKNSLGGNLATITGIMKDKDCDLLKIMTTLNDKGNSLLHEALNKKELGMAEILIDCGADISLKNKEGKSALSMIAKGSSFFLLKRLIDAQKNKITQYKNGSLGNILNSQDDDGKTVLHYSAMRGYDKTTQYLLENGADPKIKDNNGLTAYGLAHLEDALETTKIIAKWTRENDCRDIVTDFLKEKVSVITKVRINDAIEGFNEEGSNLLHFSCTKPSHQRLELILREAQEAMSDEEFIEFINQRNSTGMAPIHLLAINGREKMIKTILEYGDQKLDLLQKNQNGDTALHLAIKKGATCTAAILLQHAINNQLDCNIKNNNGQNFVQLAAFMDSKADLIKNLFNEIYKMDLNESANSNERPDSRQSDSSVKSQKSIQTVINLFKGDSKNDKEFESIILNVIKDGNDDLLKFIDKNIGITVTKNMIDMAKTLNLADTEKLLQSIKNSQKLPQNLSNSTIAISEYNSPRSPISPNIPQSSSEEGPSARLSANQVSRLGSTSSTASKGI